MGLKKRLSPEKLADYVNPPRELSFSKIGRKYGVSRQRVHQIYNEYRSKWPELFITKRDPTKEELEALLKKHTTFRAMAEELGVTTGRLKRYLQTYGLKKPFLKDLLTKEVLMQLYVVEEKSDQEISKLYRCSPNTVMKIRYDLGIYESMRKTLRQKLTRDVFIDLYEKRDLSLNQIAHLFNTHIQKVIDLRKEYNIEKKRSKGVSDEEFAKLQRELIRG